MELHIFGRFHARPGQEGGVADAIRQVLPPSQAEPGCLSIQAFHSIRDCRLFYIYSSWRDEEAFEIHSELPHTIRFLELVAPMIDHELDITRATALG
jgi:quinol monooxygenase YgiN